MDSAADTNLSIPVSLSTDICDSGQVCVCVEDVVGIPNSWRPPTGHWVADRWRPAPPQTSETLELIGDLRQEAIHTAENRVRYTLTRNSKLVMFFVDTCSTVIESLQQLSLQHGVIGDANDT